MTSLPERSAAKRGAEPVMTQAIGASGSCRKPEICCDRPSTSACITHAPRNHQRARCAEIEQHDDAMERAARAAEPVSRGDRVRSDDCRRRW